MKIKYIEYNATFNNIKFFMDKRTGYYYPTSSKKHGKKCLHVYVYEYFNAIVPEGYVIHHKDFNKLNNDIDNLEMLTNAEHSKLHGLLKYNANPEKYLDNLKKAVQKAKELHSITHTKEWHKQHYEKMKDKLHKKIIRNCDLCDKEYETIDNGKGRFCSNNCKSKYRRQQGTDLVKRRCEVCGEEFDVNRYYKTSTCGRSCSNKRMWKQRRLQS